MFKIVGKQSSTVLLFGLLGCAHPPIDTDITSTLDLADTAFEYGQLDSARSKYQSVIEQDATHHHARLMLARIDYAQDKPHSATQALVELVDDSASNAPEAALMLGRDALRQNDALGAKLWFEKGIEHDSTIASLHNGLGVALDGLGKGEQAYTHFKKALKLAPDSKSFTTNLALNCLFRGEVDQAQQLLQPLLYHNSVPNFVQRNYALILLAKGEREEAVQLLTLTMELSDALHDIELLDTELQEKLGK